MVENASPSSWPVPAAEPILHPPHRWMPADLFDGPQGNLLQALSASPFSMWAHGPAGLPTWRHGMAAMPTVALYERNGDLIVRAELPFMEPEDIVIEIEHGDLVLRAEPHAGDPSGESCSTLYRRLPMPEGIDPGAITASMHDGILEVTVPRPAAVAAPSRKIAIR